MVRMAFCLSRHKQSMLTILADDVLWDILQPEDEYLGLDHADRSRSLRNGVGDLFLR